MGKEPGLSNLTCLGVFVGCLRGLWRAGCDLYRKYKR